MIKKCMPISQQIASALANILFVSTVKLSVIVTSTKDIILSPVFVYRLSARLHKNCQTDYHETWMGEGFQPRINPINLSC